MVEDRVAVLRLGVGSVLHELLLEGIQNLGIHLRTGVSSHGVEHVLVGHLAVLLEGGLRHLNEQTLLSVHDFDVMDDESTAEVDRGVGFDVGVGAVDKTVNLRSDDRLMGDLRKLIEIALVLRGHGFLSPPFDSPLVGEIVEPSKQFAVGHSVDPPPVVFLGQNDAAQPLHGFAAVVVPCQLIPEVYDQMMIVSPKADAVCPENCLGHLQILVSLRIQ